MILVGTLYAVMAATTAAAAAAAPFNAKIADALQGDWGKINFNVRWRFEYVDQENKDIARGDPLRLRLGYLTPKRTGFRAFAEFEGNTPVFLNDYNSTRNGKGAYGTIADPTEAELNQGWLAFSKIPHTTVKAGRQKITYDNHRFVGNVGWRQMEQTFDAVDIVNRSVANSDLKFAFVWNVRTISSKSVGIAAPLLNLGYTFPDIGKLSLYGYWLDYSDAGDSGPFAFAFSTQTYGLRFKGARSFAEHFNVLYTAEYARQADLGDNSKNYGADYFHFVGGFRVGVAGSILSDVTARIGWEYLGSDDGTGLQTPLGTNHAFQGWADQFLVTPADGVKDLYGDLSAKISGVKLQAVYHQFDAAQGGDDYGHEIDALISRTFLDNYTLLLAYANYFARDYKTDTQKFWVQMTVGF